MIAKVEEELDETKSAINKQHPDAGSRRDQIEDEIGDLLFAVVNLARKSELDAEMALQKATGKFVARFNRLEDELESKGKRLGEVDLPELDEIWNKIKKANDEPLK